MTKKKWRFFFFFFLICNEKRIVHLVEKSIDSIWVENSINYMTQSILILFVGSRFGYFYCYVSKLKLNWPNTINL